MNFILNRPAIKAEARRFIGENTRWWKMTLATILIFLINNMVSFSVNFVSGFRDGFGVFRDYYTDTRTISYGSTIINLLLIPFTIAIAGYYLNHIRGFNPEWKSLYKEGFDHYGRYFLTGFLTNLFIGLWTCLLIVPGIVMSFAYSQARYIIHDNPSLPATEAIKISKIITKGYKVDLFTMYLSFFGWYLLMIPTLGILGIYVIPYVETTSAMFYENLKKNAIDSGLVVPEAFGIMPQTPLYGSQPDNMGNNLNQNYSNPAANSGYTNPQNSNYTNPTTYQPPQTQDPVPNPYESAGRSPEDTFKPGDND